ncbi:MAG: Arginyl tRNA synthetase terminal domain, partial [Planctomycetota bacterium]
MLDLLTAPVLAAIAARLGTDPAALRPLLAPPAKGFAADIALPCFQPAKAAGKPPPALAAELAELVANAGLGVTATAAGPFLNLSFGPATVAAALAAPLAAAPAALRSAAGAGRRACVDFSS